MFATYEEAADLRVPCPVCGKHKRTIFGHFQVGVETYYTLEPCDVPNCGLHCQGHAVGVQIDNGCEDHVQMVSFFQ